MTRLLVLSFTEEARAFNAFKKINEMESNGDITVYEKTMVRKKEDNDYEVLKEENTEGWKTITGIAVGGLLGILAGPVGLVVGLYAGTTVGAYSVMNHYDEAESLLRKIESNTPANTISIVAEVDENSSYLLDTVMVQMDAKITWSDTSVDYIRYYGEQIEELNNQIVAAVAELKTADAGQRKELEKKLSVLHKLRREKLAAIRAEEGKTLAATES